jgi:hypothetical protein
LVKSKEQFKDVRMLQAFSTGLDLSFYEDSYKLVEAPYLGMDIKVLLPMETDLRMAIVAEI